MQDAPNLQAGGVYEFTYSFQEMQTFPGRIMLSPLL
jgi:hypothetical protein